MSAPYMPLYIPDLFADTMHLNCLERGAYMQLLCHMWRGGGKLPADDARLSRLLQLTQTEWVEIKDIILPFFIKRGNSISQKRLSKELAKYDNKIVKAKNAIKARWSKKPNENNENKDTDVLPTYYQQEQEQEQVIDKSIIEKNKTKKEIYKSEFLEFWAMYPHKVGKPVAEQSYSKARDKNFTKEQIFEGLEKYIKSKPPDRSWLNPATFINQERFTDEPDNSIQTSPSNNINHNAAARQKPRNAIDRLVERAIELNTADIIDDFECDQPNLQLISSC